MCQGKNPKLPIHRGSPRYRHEPTKGDAGAQYFLGYLNDAGRGVAQDYGKAGPGIQMRQGEDQNHFNRLSCDALSGSLGLRDEVCACWL